MISKFDALIYLYTNNLNETLTKMKTLRKIASRWYVNYPLTFMLMFFLTQCSPSEKSPASQYTGEDMFNATFFAYGPMAAKLSTQSKKNEAFQALTPEGQADFKARVDQFAALIQQQDPQFFTRFKADIDSRDHIKIRKAVDEGSLLIAQNFERVFPEIAPLVNQVKADVQQEAFVTNGKLDMSKVEKKQGEYERLLKNNLLSSDGRKMACTLALACAAYIALAVHSYVALTVVAAVAIMTWKYIAFAEMPYQDQVDPLQLEMMVDELANVSEE